MGPFFGGFSELELKKQLNLATHRFQVSIDKRSASVRKQKQEIASMLAEKPYPKEEKARIRAEGLIREDNAVEAMEILQLTCKTLHEHIRLLSNQKECPSDHVSSVSTLIWASKRFEDVPELQKIISQFRSKYGKKFVEAAIMNAGGICDERVVGKLITDATTPSILVQSYLENIAKEFGLVWKPMAIDAPCLSPSISTPIPVPVTPPPPAHKPIPHLDQKPLSPPLFKPGVIPIRNSDPAAGPASNPVKSVVEPPLLDTRIEQPVGKGFSPRPKNDEGDTEKPEDFFDQIARLTR